MKRLLLYLLLAVSVGVFAQQQSNEEGAAQAAPEQGVDSAPEAAGESPAEQDESAVEQEDEASAPADDDFDPAEEISEDFPVPLPSDI